MAKRQIFYSFDFDYDVMRVQQIRNIGFLEDNKPVSANKWEEIRKKGYDAIKEWVDDTMAYRSCVVVLVGGRTASRPWVKYEIEKAWKDQKGLVGIYIHNISCPRNGKSYQGVNPFDQFKFEDGNKLSSVVKCYNPPDSEAYTYIKKNLEDIVEEAIKIRLSM